MRSTMMDVPLTVTALMRYGTSAYGEHVVVTAAEEGTRCRTYAETGRRAARLAGALRRLGVNGDQRVGTLMWNNAEHLEAYLAVPSMGAVLHTLNLRLDPGQLGYIAQHAGDYAIIVDGTLVPLLAKVLPAVSSVRHVIVTPGSDRTAAADTSELEGEGRSVHAYEDLLAAEPDTFGWPDLDERSAAAMCYTSGTTGSPKGVAYSHRSTYLHSMGVCMGNTFSLSEHDRVLPVVPMFHANAWGLPYAAVLAGADLIMPDRFLQAAPTGPPDRGRAAHAGRSGAHDLERGAAARARERRGPVLAAPGALRRLGGPARAAGGLRVRARRADPARLGDDGNLAARQRGARACRAPLMTRCGTTGTARAG